MIALLNVKFVGVLTKKNKGAVMDEHELLINILMKAELTLFGEDPDGERAKKCLQEIVDMGMEVWDNKDK